jgi:hypothetical protein
MPDFRWLLNINFKEKKMKKLMVLVAALALVAASAMTAAAADWNFYGSARIATYFQDSDDNYRQALQGNSRIGANVKVSDELTGRFEYGHGGGNTGVRLLYGEWNFGAGSLLVGQTYSPLNMFPSLQVGVPDLGYDTNLLAFGGVYSGRERILQLKFGDFKIAAVPVANVPAGGESQFPAIEASYSMKFDAFSLGVAGGYQSYDTAAGDVSSYMIAVEGGANFGAAYLKGSVYMGENAGDLIWISTGGGNDGTGAPGADVDNLGFVLVAGMKVNDFASFETGYGWAEIDLGAADDEVKSYYLQATLTLAPGVYVIPEIGQVDEVEAGQGDYTYYGAKWQINF